MKQVFREPLTHFLAIGAALFLLFQWTGGPTGWESGRIVITPGQIEHLRVGFARTWQRPPTERELKGLIDEHVRDEIVSREARAIGLDREDPIIRRRLRQKLEFALDDTALSPAPTDADLQAWLESHPDAFRREPQIAFRQVYLNRIRRGAVAEADARKLLARLAALGPEADLAEIGDSLMVLPQQVELTPRSEVARLFGDPFTDRLLQIEPGRWTGPLESGYGLHLVLVRKRIAEHPPELSEVRGAVERDFLAARRKERLDAMYQRLLQRYTVVVEGSRPATRAAADAR
jgi:hypothetical protein